MQKMQSKLFLFICKSTKRFIASVLYSFKLFITVTHESSKWFAHQMNNSVIYTPFVITAAYKYTPNRKEHSDDNEK